MTEVSRLRLQKSDIMFGELSMQVASLWPVWLLVAMALVLLAAQVHGTVTMLRKHVAPRWVAGLTFLRLGAWIVFLMIVLQPALSWSQTQAPRPTLAVLVDVSASMKEHRPEIDAALSSEDFIAALESRFYPRWFRFDRTALPVSRGDLGRPADGATTDGATTHIADSLAAAHGLLHAEGMACPRVLLVSDGLDQSGDDAAALARRLGVRVDVIAPKPKSSTAAGAIEIVDVQGARRVLLGSETHFRVTLRGAKPAAQDAKLNLHMIEDGKRLVDLPVAWTAGQRERVVTLAHRPGVSGTRTLQFQLADAASKPVDFPVQVVDSKFEILVLEDTWRWDYKFLHRLFEDDPSFRFTALLARGGGSFTQFGSPDRRVNLIGFPQSRGELEGFDLFFAGDVNPTRWPPRLASGLAQLVTDEGKSLVVIAGPQLASFLDVPELHALLPVELVPPSAKPLTGPVPVRLRGDAASSPFFFQISPDLVDALPPLDQIYPPLRKRPGATVLVEAAKHRNPYGPLVVAAEHTVGRGRVLFIGTDTLWKWHTLAPASEGPTPYGLFWQQALRALTPERSRLGAADIWLSASRSRAAVGQAVELVAEVQSERPLNGAKIEAQAGLPDGERIPLVLAADAARPKVYRAALAPPRPGTYAIAATVSVDGPRVAETRILVHVDEPRGEVSDGSVDLGYLERLATMTGGKLIDPARPDTWPQPDETAAVTVPRTHVFPLLDNFTLLLLLCGLLGIDWFARLMKGLV